MMSAQSPDDSLAFLHGAYKQIDKRMDSLDMRMDSLDKRMEGFGSSLEGLRAEVNRGFQEFSAKADTNLRWCIGTILGVGGAVLAATLGTVIAALITHKH